MAGEAARTLSVQDSDVVIAIPRPEWKRSGTDFPNLATGFPLVKEVKTFVTDDPLLQEIRARMEHVDAVVKAECEQAGLKVEGYECFREACNGCYNEVPTQYIGSASDLARTAWVFHRAWRYYVAEGPGIPPQIAQMFWQDWGPEARVAGHCGCPSPYEWHNGFAVGLYHIDSQAALNAFAKLLKGISFNAEGYATRR